MKAKPLGLKSRYLQPAIIGVVGVVLGAAACGALSTPAEDPDTACHLAFSTGHVLKQVPVASTYRQMVKGLSGASEPSASLFFVWPDSQQRSFWMLRTDLPLSLLFIDDNGEILEVVDMAPGSEQQHKSPAPVREALELYTPLMRSLGLKAGDRITARFCFPLP